MIDILQQIHNNTSGSAIIVGGVAKWLNGYTETYDKMWVDVSIENQYSNSLDNLGTRLNLPNGTSFPPPIIDQFIIAMDNGYRLDVFVKDELTDFSIISGSNVQTPQGDINWHTNLHSSIGSDYTLGKLNDLKELYGL
jgi:hypothetical protein